MAGSGLSGRVRILPCVADEPKDKGGSTGMYVRVGYPYSALHHSVSGAPSPVTDEWSEEPVGDAALKKLRKLAKDNSTPLEESSKGGSS